MDKKKELPKRKPTRLNGFDYSTSGIYFITICTENRRQILSQIVGVPQNEESSFGGSRVGVPQSEESSFGGCRVGGDVLDAPKSVRLLPYGKIVEKYIKQLDVFYDNLSVDKYVIMPNHIHILLLVSNDGALRLSENGASRTSPPTTRQHSLVSQFVSTLKRFCNKEYGQNIWQRHFYDHIIRNRQDYDEHVRYIHENPARWFYDELYAEE